MTNTSFKGALAGLKVLDFGHYYAGPLAAMLLADQGADVVHVTEPGKKELPDQQYRLFNRNKKLLELDLKSEEGKAQALALIKGADVLIENFRPSVMKRLGLDYTSVKQVNPDLVYLSLPGFASTDEERRHIQAWEGILSAASGMFVSVSYVRSLLNFPPVYTSLPVCSIMGAAHGVVAIMASLISREKNGVGTCIEVPLVDAGKTGLVHRFYLSRIMGPHSANVGEARKPGIQEKIKLWEEQKQNWYSSTDTPEVQSGKLFEGIQNLWGPLFRYYRCADGRWVRLCCMGSVRRNMRLFQTLGIYAYLLEEGFVNISPAISGDDLIHPRYLVPGSAINMDNNISAYALMSDERKRHLSEILTQTFLTKTSDEWDALLGPVLPFSKVRTREEWLRLEPMLKSGLLARMDNGNSTLTVPGRFVDVSGPDGRLIESSYAEPEIIAPSQALSLFKNSALPWSDDTKTSSVKKGDLLKGLKVLDLGTWVAGPMSSYVLAQYGAEVVKIDEASKAGKPGAVHFDLGKRSILIDLQTTPGKEILGRLVSSADILVSNKLDQVAERLGIRHHQLQVINPDCVVGQVSAFGGPERGFWERRFGTDPISQAATGLMTQYGSMEKPHDFEGTMIADALSGFGLAFGSLLGVWQRQRTGYAGEVRTSLVRAGNFFQLPFMISENGCSDGGEPHGQFTKGEFWWRRMYACSDGWLYVDATEGRVNEFATMVTGHAQGDEGELEAAFAAQSCRWWEEKLGQAHIAYHRVLGIDDICNQGMRRVTNEEADEMATGQGEVIYWENPPCGYPIVLQATDWVRIGEEHSWKRVTPTPINGEHTTEILQEAGYSAEDIANLFNLKVVA